MADRTKVKYDPAFVQGYVCAVANILATHDEPTIAKDVLKGVGKVNWTIIDEYDREILAKAGLCPPPHK